MEQKKTDRRVLKTKKAIYNAFAKLASERDINDITIRDIVDIADINRKTFYNYYSGIYALLDEIEDNIVNTFVDIMGDIDFREALNDPTRVFEKLTSIINNNIDFYGYLISTQSNSNLVTKIVGVLKEKTREALISQLPDLESKADIILDFIFSGMLSVYQNWFLSENRPPIGSTAETVSFLCSGGINCVLDNTVNQAG